MNHHSACFAGTVRFLLVAALLPILAGCLSIHKAANKGNLPAVKAFLKKGTDVDARDVAGRTPLMYMLSDLESVRYLVGAGADVNARDELGETPLMKAAWVGKRDVVKFLAESGADLDAQSENGETALMRAVRNPDVVKCLVERGADVNAKDRKGETVLLKASVSGRLSVVQYLLKNGAAVEAGTSADGAR